MPHTTVLSNSSSRKHVVNFAELFLSHTSITRMLPTSSYLPSQFQRVLQNANSFVVPTIYSKSLICWKVAFWSSIIGKITWICKQILRLQMNDSVALLLNQFKTWVTSLWFNTPLDAFDERCSAENNWCFEIMCITHCITLWEAANQMLLCVKFSFDATCFANILIPDQIQHCFE